MAKHIHKYKKEKIGRKRDYVVFRCMLPDCNHYLPENMVVGKESICWRCDKPFLITKTYKGVVAKPHCKACTKPNRNPAYRKKQVRMIEPNKLLNLAEELIAKGKLNQ